jgi:antitoxin (DNA-binding transcriptional repressor) of toxin-antitoxin stability system
LSEYVREVRSGEGVLVTDRGEVVAELLPPGQGLDESGVPSGLRALVRRGQLTLGASNEATLYPKLSPLLKRHRAAVLLDEERARYPVNIYAESSAVLAWLLGEAADRRVREVLRRAELVMASDLVLIECDRVLICAVTLGEIDEATAPIAGHT